MLPWEGLGFCSFMNQNESSMLQSHSGQPQTFLGRTKTCAKASWVISRWDGREHGRWSSSETASQKRPVTCALPEAFLFHTLWIQVACWFISMIYILWVPGTEHTVPVPDHTTEQTRKLSGTPSKTHATFALSLETWSSSAGSEAHFTCQHWSQAETKQLGHLRG